MVCGVNCSACDKSLEPMKQKYLACLTSAREGREPLAVSEVPLNKLFDHGVAGEWVAVVRANVCCMYSLE